MAQKFQNLYVLVDYTQGIKKSTKADHQIIKKVKWEGVFVHRHKKRLLKRRCIPGQSLVVFLYPNNGMLVFNENATNITKFVSR